MSSMQYYNSIVGSQVKVSGDNVGIGTSSPNTKLEVANSGNTTIRANNTSDNIINILNVDSDKGYIGTITDHDLRIGTNSNGRIIISNTGNVGIGVDPDLFIGDSPSHHPSFVLGDGDGHTSQTIYSAAGSAGIIYFADGTGTSQHAQGYIQYTHSADHMQFATNKLVRMRIDSSGNVGIGAFTPQTKLDVSGIITATSGNSTQWNTAYGWGDHSTSGYLTAHPNISSASSSNNSGQVFIQDVLLDTNGHVTGLAVATASGGGADTNTEYTPGTGLDLSGTEFNIDNTVLTLSLIHISEPTRPY